MKFIIALIFILSGCGAIPLFYEFDLKHLETTLIQDNQLDRANLNITNCSFAATTLDDKKYSVSIPLLDDPKVAIFYQGVCALDVKTRIIYFEPLPEHVEYWKKYNNNNLLKKIYPDWYSNYGEKDIPNILMGKFPGGQLHLIGKYLYVFDMPREKIKEFEKVLIDLNISNVEIRRTVQSWNDMNISTSSIRGR
jgi:hypothetical protein